MEAQNYDLNKNCNLNYNENIREGTEEGLKTSIENILVDGFNVQNKKSYDSVKKLLKIHNIIGLCSYEDIIDGYKIGERTDKYQFSLSYNKEENIVYVYPASDAGFSSQCGYIQNGKYTESINIFNIDISNNNKNTLPIQECASNQIPENQELRREQEELGELRSQVLDLQNQMNTQQCPIIEIEEVEEVEENEINSINQIEGANNLVVTQPIEDIPDIQEGIPRDKDYIVKSGDNLWSIVEKYYGLTNNRDIANYVNKLVKYNIAQNTDKRNIADDNTPDGIFGDKIYIGQKIILAKELTFRNKTIPLINKET